MAGPHRHAADPSDTELRGYRPHLDGLRAVAVYLVVVFHAGAGRFEGGFIGVDIFFVLSGFLVTRVIVTSWTDERFRLREFYARRARRLLPAAVVCILGIAWLWARVTSPAEVLAVDGGFTAAALYYANWFFIAESADYFAADLEASPVLHFWSLSIEEQFYIVWPLALIGLLSLTERFRWGHFVIRLLVATAAFASLWWAIHLSGIDLNRAYYGTDTRAYQLLAGALLALSPRWFPRSPVLHRLGSVLSVAALGALVVLATSIIDVAPVWRGAWTVVATLFLLVSLEVAAGPVKAFLTTSPMIYLGQISYGTYLWHWPIVLVAQIQLDLSALDTFLLAAVTATGLAALSSRLLERPLRDAINLDRFPVRVVAGGLALSLLVALVATPFLTDPVRAGGRHNPRGEDSASLSPDAPVEDPLERVRADTVDWRSASEDKTAGVRCIDTTAADCIVVSGSGPHVTLIGDSHAVMLIDVFAEIARTNDFTLSVVALNGCGWPETLEYPFRSRAGQDSCDHAREVAYSRLLDELGTDVIVTSIRAPDDPQRPVEVVGVDSNHPTQIGSFVGDLAVRTVDRLTDDTRRIVLLEPLPVTAPRNDPIACLSDATFVDECAFEASPTSELERRFRALAASNEAVYSIDYDHLACPSMPLCEAVIGGTVVRWDETHLTRTYAVSIAEDLAELLAEPLDL